MSMDFGDYCLIEHRRYGCENKEYLYKVISRFISNAYVTVPVDHGPGKTGDQEVRGDMVEVVSCIECGVCETKVLKFRLEDVRPNDTFKTSRSINFNEDRISGALPDE